MHYQPLTHPDYPAVSEALDEVRAQFGGFYSRGAHFFTKEEMEIAKNFDIADFLERARMSRAKFKLEQEKFMQEGSGYAVHGGGSGCEKVPRV